MGIQVWVAIDLKWRQSAWADIVRTSTQFSIEAGTVRGRRVRGSELHWQTVVQLWYLHTKERKPAWSKRPASVSLSSSTRSHRSCCAPNETPRRTNHSKHGWICNWNQNGCGSAKIKMVVCWKRNFNWSGSMHSIHWNPLLLYCQTWRRHTMSFISTTIRMDGAMLSNGKNAARLLLPFTSRERLQKNAVYRLIFRGLWLMNYSRFGLVSALAWTAMAPRLGHLSRQLLSVFAATAKTFLEFVLAFMIAVQASSEEIACVMF